MIISEAGIVLVGHEVTTVQSDTTANTVKDYTFPFGFIVLDWGVVLTEDWAAQTQDWVVGISKLDKTGGTATVIATCTVGNSNTNLKKGDGVKEAQTAIAIDTELLNGHVVWGPRSTMPHHAKTSNILRLLVTTASTTTGGAGTIFAFVKPILDARAAKVWVDVG